MIGVLRRAFRMVNRKERIPYTLLGIASRQRPPRPRAVSQDIASMSASSALPDGVVIESLALRSIHGPDWLRLRQLTSGEPDSHMRALLRERPEQARCFLARRDADILGWSVARWYKPLAERPRNAHISVFIDPAWRRHGLGRVLTSAASDFVAALGLAPWVSAADDAQLAFYQTCPTVRIARAPFLTR
jgi:GNAT superfamily N-acetyltransferase